MFERGDLLLVPFPFSDLSATKRRPVLALTEPDRYGDFIAIPVTSADRARSAAHGGRFGARRVAGAELDSHRPYRHAQFQSRCKVSWTRFRARRGSGGRAVLRSYWIRQAEVMLGSYCRVD